MRQHSVMPIEDDRGWSNYYHSDYETFIPPEPSNKPSHTPPPLAPLQNFAPPPSLAQLPSLTFIPDYNEFIAIAKLYLKPTQMAVNLFSEIFKVEKAEGIFRNGEYNLYGRSSKGSVEVKKALDAAKFRYLRSLL